MIPEKVEQKGLAVMLDGDKNYLNFNDYSYNNYRYINNINY